MQSKLWNRIPNSKIRVMLVHCNVLDISTDVLYNNQKNK